MREHDAPDHGAECKGLDRCLVVCFVPAVARGICQRRHDRRCGREAIRRMLR